jgi:hypothetical protein
MSQQSGEVAQPPYPREPNVHSGGKQDPGGDRELPPYDDRQQSGPSQEELASNPQKTGAGSGATPRQTSQAEREGVSPTDTTAASPHGVGVSTSTQGNEPPLTDSEAAHRSDRMDAGISQEQNVDPESPAMRTGDQGG